MQGCSPNDPSSGRESSSETRSSWHDRVPHAGVRRGTLHESWRLYDSLPVSFARAAFAMFLVSEVHPFADGNGRMARLFDER
jgi:Fic/DOC family